MRIRDRQFAVTYVALDALERCIFLSLIDLVIDGTTVRERRCSVTCSTCRDRDLLCFNVERIHRRDGVAGRAIKVDVY